MSEHIDLVIVYYFNGEKELFFNPCKQLVMRIIANYEAKLIKGYELYKMIDNRFWVQQP